MKVKKGQYVLHLQHGVGKVLSIKSRKFYGQPEASYVELYFQREKMTLTLLESDLSDFSRPLISQEEAYDLLDQVKGWDGKAKTQWKQRSNAHQAAIESGQPFECAKVIKALAQMREENSLRPCDLAHLNKSSELLTDELACTLNKPVSQAQKLISQAIGAPL
jgi:CarD family transcriptional regulator